MNEPQLTLTLCVELGRRLGAFILDHKPSDPTIRAIGERLRETKNPGDETGVFTSTILRQNLFTSAKSS